MTTIKGCSTFIPNRAEGARALPAVPTSSQVSRGTFLHWLHFVSAPDTKQGCRLPPESILISSLPFSCDALKAILICFPAYLVLVWRRSVDLQRIWGLLSLQVKHRCRHRRQITLISRCMKTFLHVRSIRKEKHKVWNGQCITATAVRSFKAVESHNLIHYCALALNPVSKTTWLTEMPKVQNKLQWLFAEASVRKKAVHFGIKSWKDEGHSFFSGRSGGNKHDVSVITGTKEARPVVQSAVHKLIYWRPVHSA